MALLASPIEIRIDGDDNNGGGFNAARGGVDYSQQANAQVIITDGVIGASSSRITSTSGLFTPQLVGNYVQANGGFFEIILYENPNSIALDRNPTATALSGLTLRIGGALATPGKAASVNNSGKAWIRRGSYTTTTTTANVSGGPISHNNTTMFYEGYENTRGDRGLKPVLRPHANSMLLCTANASSTTGTFTNIAVDGNGFTSITGFTTANRSFTRECDAYNCAVGFSGVAERCYASNCTSGFTAGNYVWCVANGSSSQGFSGATCFECIALACGSGFLITTNGAMILAKCVAHGCVNGMVNQSSASRFLNCIVSNCTNKGFNWNGVKSTVAIASYNCATNDYAPDFLLTASPFAGAGATINSLYDAFAAFALNDIAGGGAMLRGMGLMGYSDIGAVQHQGASGSSSMSSLFGSSIISAGGRTT